MNYQEYKQFLNQKLTDKVQKELSAFREEMQGKPPQKVYDAAYQIAIKNDIAECFSNMDYSPQMKQQSVIFHVFQKDSDFN